MRYSAAPLLGSKDLAFVLLPCTQRLQGAGKAGMAQQIHGARVLMCRICLLCCRHAHSL